MAKKKTKSTGKKFEKDLRVRDEVAKKNESLKPGQTHREDEESIPRRERFSSY